MVKLKIMFSFLKQVIKRGIGVFIFGFAICLAINTYGQSKKTESKAEAVKLIKLRHAVDTYPDDTLANQKLIFAWGIDDSTLLIQYNYWLKKFPRSSVIPLTIGLVLSKEERPEAKRFLLKAVEINSNLSRAWFYLYIDASFRNDSLGEHKYLENAVKTDPENPDYAYNYAKLFEFSDTATYHRLAIGLSKRFPKDEVGAKALNVLAKKEKNIKQKIIYYELLKDRYAKQKGDWYMYGMTDYFKLMLLTDPQKALEIARFQKMRSRIKLADTIIKVNELLNEKKADEADQFIRHVQISFIAESLLLIKAQVADAANHTEAAYDTLRNFYIKSPSDTLQKAMLYYGSKLGLTNVQVKSDVKKMRDSTAKQATDFSLYNYLTKKYMSLADFRGKVILLTYWFPGCGPCRGEFPFFEKIIRKFNRNNVAYLGLNVEPSQDDYVAPFLKSSGFSFIPLRDNWNRQKGNLEAPGAPTNYLIDQDGRIIFSNFRINEENENTLEIMINDLLQPYNALDNVTDTATMK
jgi:thiol-disulfide isomerase/thioredoxin